MIDKLGPYRIEKILGRGGMGTVYAGVHESDGSRVAIKMLSLVLADDTNFRDRFIAEIETLKKLDHPNIVRLLGDGEQDGHLFFVMELVEGRSLQAELQTKHEFEWPEVRAIGLDICRALRHAHDRGIIHRDLKPANLLRSSPEQVKLTDFGIAKLFGGSHLTADGSVVGTADYMSPEQAEGKPVTIRTDLYSLGSVMYTLLARRPPFAANSVAQVVHKLRYEEAPSVRRYAPKVPGELEVLIAELLSKDPVQRVSNVVVLANRLEAVGLDLSESLSQTVIEPDPAADPSVTRVSPTEINGPPAPPRGSDFSWNEATVVTSGNDAEPTPAADEPTGSPEVERPKAGQNRFTELDDVARRAALEAAELRRNRDGGQAILLAICFVILLAGTAWLLWPPSADKLYGEIREITAAQGSTEAKKQIDHFLARFPEDPRFDEIDRLRLDVECEWLQSRLALRSLTSGGSRLADFEQEALEAMRALDRNPVDGIVQLRAFMERFETASPQSEPLDNCLTAIRHLLNRSLEASRDPT